MRECGNEKILAVCVVLVAFWLIPYAFGDSEGGSEGTITVTQTTTQTVSNGTKPVENPGLPQLPIQIIALIGGILSIVASILKILESVLKKKVSLLRIFR